MLNKISNWQRIFFLNGGKKVLIKAIPQATSAYVMSVFRIPIGLCANIQNEIARFLWETKRNYRGIH